VFADLAARPSCLADDAEELRDLLGDVYVTLARCAGRTADRGEFIGDAVMAVFGVPVAHEDDAERAVQAALLMRSRLAAVARGRCRWCSDRRQHGLVVLDDAGP
jgi:class 3 adenylate cyclase